MKLIGHTILKINGKTVFEKKNALTKWVYTAPVEGNFHDTMVSSKILPLSQWFSGCLLFDRNMEDIQTTINISMPDSGAKVVAQAADDDGTQSGNLKRGSKDTFRVLPNGIEHSWQWTANRGNGTIGAVALTRAHNGKVLLGDSYNQAGVNDAPILEVLHRDEDGVNSSNSFGYASSDPDILAISRAINIIDYEKEIGYIVEQINNSTEGVNTIRVRGYKYATKYTHLNGTRGCVENATPIVDESYVGVIPFSNTWSYTYQGKYIFVINDYGESNKLDILKINTEDWTSEFFNFTLSFTHRFAEGGKDSYPIYYTEENGVVTEWVIFVNLPIEILSDRIALKIARVDLLNPNNPPKFYEKPIPNGYNQQYPCMMLPNGDWYQMTAGAGGIFPYYSKADDKFYAVRGFDYAGVNPNINGAATYGTVVLKKTDGMWLAQTYPCISTINNLDSLVTKRTGDIMQLIYRILEVEEGEEE